MQHTPTRSSRRASDANRRASRQRISWLLGTGVAIAAVLASFFTQGSSSSAKGSAKDSTRSTRATAGSAAAQTSSNRSDPRLRAIGFASESKLRQHYAKHGREFGSISQDQYLAMAQDLRDAPLSKTVIETEQPGGTISRFDRRSGAFMAFNPNLVIRTFFRPNDGEDYFWRAAKRSH